VSVSPLTLSALAEPDKRRNKLFASGLGTITQLSEPKSSDPGLRVFASVPGQMSDARGHSISASTSPRVEERPSRPVSRGDDGAPAPSAPYSHPVGGLDRAPERAAPAAMPPKRRPLRRLVVEFDSRMVALLPSVADVSIEGFVNQVELLFQVESHRILAARYTYLLSGEEVENWTAMKRALLAKAKRATAASLTVYHKFSQGENETINGAWERFTQLARNADIKRTKMELWSYFKERLNQTSKLLFRSELAEQDPFTALPMIAAAGDVPVSSRATLLAYQPQEDDRPHRDTKCWSCGKRGHIKRRCRASPEEKERFASTPEGKSIQNYVRPPQKDQRAFRKGKKPYDQYKRAQDSSRGEEKPDQSKPRDHDKGERMASTGKREISTDVVPAQLITMFKPVEGGTPPTTL